MTVLTDACSVKICNDRGAEEQIDHLLEEVVSEVEVVPDGLFRDPGEAEAPLEIEKCLVFTIRDKGIKVVVFTPGGLGRAGGGRALADADTDLQWRSRARFAYMTKGFKRSEEDISAVGEDPYRIAERVEGICERQMNVCPKRVLRPRYCRGGGKSGFEHL